MLIKELLERLDMYDSETETNIEDVRHFSCNCCGKLEVDLLSRFELQQMAQEYMETHPEEFEDEP